MPKNALISLKNCKNRPALGTPPPDPLCIRRRLLTKCNALHCI